MKHDLTGRRIVITGASSGIGEATTLALAERGMTCILSGRRSDALDALSQRLGGDVETIPADLRAATSRRRLGSSHRNSCCTWSIR